MANTNYIRLQELVFDTFNLDAPVEIEKGALLLESISKTILLQLRLNVLDNPETISSVSLRIMGFTDSGEDIEGFSPYLYTFTDIYLHERKSFGDRTPIILDPKIRKVDVELDKVVFCNGKIWTNTEKYFRPPKQKSINSIKSDLLTQFEREINYFSTEKKEKLIFIPLQSDDYWICTCGRPNKNDIEICTRCGLKKRKVFNITDENALQENLDKYNEDIRVKEEQKKKEEEERKVLTEKRKKNTTISSGLIGGVAVLLILFFVVIQPAINYAKANNYLNDSDFDNAISIFSSLGNYKNSGEMVEEANYQKAKAFLEAGDSDEAIKTFLAYPDYKDSNELITKVIVDLLTDGNIPDLIYGIDENTYSEIINNLASKSSSLEIYNFGLDFFKKGYYNGALEFFQKVPDYEDAGTYIKKIVILNNIRSWIWQDSQGNTIKLTSNIFLNDKEYNFFPTFDKQITTVFFKINGETYRYQTGGYNIFSPTQDQMYSMAIPIFDFLP